MVKHGKNDNSHKADGGVKTRIYHDEMKDEFSGIVRETREVGADFPYIHKNLLWRAASFVVYRIIMTPFAYIYPRIKYGVRVVGREAVSRCGGRGFFIYANHTLTDADPYVPNVISFPQRNYTLVNADNISAKGTKNYVLMCGAIPLPQSSVTALRRMTEAIGKRIADGCSVTVYPEAHIWPFYTGIRRFSPGNVSFPVRFSAPVITATTTYAPPRRSGGEPRVTVYVDGPFYPDASLPRRAAEEKLADEIYSTMCARARLSSYEAVHYVKECTEQPAESAAQKGSAE